jgi:hypothetical protein
MALSATLANADVPKTEAQKECTNDGDLYTTSTDAGGNTFESCCYKSGVIIEMNHCDVWVNGKWNKDLSSKPLGPTVTTPREQRSFPATAQSRPSPDRTHHYGTPAAGSPGGGPTDVPPSRYSGR